MIEDFSFEEIKMFSCYINVESLSFAGDEFLVRDDGVIILSYLTSGKHT